MTRLLVTNFNFKVQTVCCNSCNMLLCNSILWRHMNGADVPQRVLDSITGKTQQFQFKDMSGKRQYSTHFYEVSLNLDSRQLYSARISIGSGLHRSSAFLSFLQMSPLKYAVLTVMTRLKPKQIDLRHTDYQVGNIETNILV